MTAHKKLGALFATAFLALALSGGAAMAGHGHKSNNSQGQDSQYRYGQNGNYEYQSHKKRKAYGWDARRYYLKNGGSWQPKAYGYRSHNNYVYGNGYQFKPSQGDHRPQAYWRKRWQKHQGHRHRHQWQGSQSGSRFMFGQQDDQTDHRKKQRFSSGSGFGGNGDSCFTKRRKKTVDGQTRMVIKEICRGADGKTYTVPGSRVEYLLN